MHHIIKWIEYANAILRRLHDLYLFCKRIFIDLRTEITDNIFYGIAKENYWYREAINLMIFSDKHSAGIGRFRIFMVLLTTIYLSLYFSATVLAGSDSVLAGCGVADSVETETEDPNSWANSEPAPFSIKIRFDEDYEVLTRKDTKNWRRLTPAGYYIWDNEPVREYLGTLKEKYDSENGKVSFDTHRGVHMVFKSQQCGWHMNIDASLDRLKEDVDDDKKVTNPAWNSGCVYSSKNGVGSRYVEISIEEQKVYLIENYEVVYETDCVTGTKGYSDTHTGVYQIQSKASPTVLKDKDKNDKPYEQPVEYWMGFNGSQGMHDAIWRGEFGGEIYKSWGSHGCVNLPLDAAKKIYDSVYMYYPVIVY